MAKTNRVLTGAVNIHKDLHVVAVIDERGEILKRAKLSRSCLGLSGARVLAALLGAKLAKVGVEGTGSYGGGWPATSPTRALR